MNKKEVEKIYKQKINLLKKYNKSYFDKNTSIVSDKDYDELKKEIFSLEKKYNFLKSKDSPSQIVGHKPSTTQDLYAKRPLEIDPIIGSIIEVGNKLNVDTSTLKLKNNELKLKAEKLGLYNRSDSIDKITK